MTQATVDETQHWLRRTLALALDMEVRRRGAVGGRDVLREAVNRLDPSLNDVFVEMDGSAREHLTFRLRTLADQYDATDARRAELYRMAAVVIAGALP